MQCTQEPSLVKSRGFISWFRKTLASLNARQLSFTAEDEEFMTEPGSNRVQALDGTGEIFICSRKPSEVTAMLPTWGSSPSWYTDLRCKVKSRNVRLEVDVGNQKETSLRLSIEMETPTKQGRRHLQVSSPDRACRS